MNKRGQFYIVAALIIALALSGLTAVSTYAIVKPAPNAINSLSLDLKLEAPKIFDYGVYQKENADLLLGSFTEEEFAPYFLQKTENSNIIFIYGNKTNLYGVRYNSSSTGNVYATIGGESNWYMAGPFSEKLDINVHPGDDNIEVSILNKNFKFDLRENEMFYFVIAQEKEGEIYVQRN